MADDGIERTERVSGQAERPPPGSRCTCFQVAPLSTCNVRLVNGGGRGKGKEEGRLGVELGSARKKKKTKHVAKRLLLFLVGL